MKGNSITLLCHKKKAGSPSATRARASSLSFAEVRLVIVHHAFYPRAHCEAIVYRTSHPVLPMLVPMTSAMGIFTRESLIPPWESRLHHIGRRSARITNRRGYARHICPVIRLDYIFYRWTIHNVVLCVAKREEYA